MLVYRLSRAKYSKKLDGIGAAKFGNRWNSKGTEMVYTAQSRALALAEVAVHLSIATLPSDYRMIEIEIPSSIKVGVLYRNRLPALWNQYPHIKGTQVLGDKFVQNQKMAVMKVPSAVVQGDYNFLINPNHKDASKIKIKSIEPFPLDKRLFK